MFNLTKSENRALLILVAVLVASAFIQWLQPYQMDSKLFDYSLQDSLFKTYSPDTLQLQKNDPPFVARKKPSEKMRIKKQSLKKKSININSASKKELERLPRIGPVNAQRILEKREQLNGFSRIEDLLKVKGIGPKTLQKIKPFIYIEADNKQKKQVSPSG